jgi:hypothetical protein
MLEVGLSADHAALLKLDPFSDPLRRSAFKKALRGKAEITFTTDSTDS